MRLSLFTLAVIGRIKTGARENGRRRARQKPFNFFGRALRTFHRISIFSSSKDPLKFRATFYAFVFIKRHCFKTPKVCILCILQMVKNKGLQVLKQFAANSNTKIVSKLIISVSFMRCGKCSSIQLLRYLVCVSKGHKLSPHPSQRINS